MSDNYDIKDASTMAHHEPKEGFDPTEPDSARISLFVIGSVILLLAVIVTLQHYFDGVWNDAVYEKVLSAPGPEVQTQRALEAWRLSHYEYTTEAKSEVRLPFDRAKQLFLEEAAAGKTFYPAKPTEPKPEEPGKDASTDKGGTDKGGTDKGGADKAGADKAGAEKAPAAAEKGKGVKQ